jgi:hypothetical protein
MKSSLPRPRPIVFKGVSPTVYGPYNDYVATKVYEYQKLDLQDETLWLTFKEDFQDWTIENFNKCCKVKLAKFRGILRQRGIWVENLNKVPATQSLLRILHEEVRTEWSEQETEKLPVTLEAATSLTTPQNSTITSEGVTDLTTSNHSITTEMENQEDGNNSIITAKTNNTTSPDSLTVALPVSGTLRTTDPLSQFLDKARSCLPGEHVPERLCDKDDCWSSHDKSPGHSGPSSRSLGPAGEQGCGKESEGHNRDSGSSTMGEQNLKIIIPLDNNCCTLCDLCPTGTDPKQHLPEPGDSSEHQES